MLRIVIGLFFILHGLVHLLYFGQSWRLFELQPGMTWPQGSWAFSNLPGAGMVNRLAGILLVLAALGFVAGGAGTLFRQTWWGPVVMISAIFSSAIFLLFWNGQFRQLDNQGAIGILINLAILIAVLILKRSNVSF